MVLLAGTGHAQANADISDIGRYITASLQDTPALVSGFAYLLGILFGVIAILKTKGHVEDPRSTKLWEPLAYGLVAGMMLALPTVIEMVINTIAGDAGNSVDNDTFFTQFSSIMGDLTIPGIGDLNVIMKNILDSVQDIPLLVGSIAYLLGLITIMSAVITIKDHIEDPKNVPARHYVRKFLLAGALFALPTIVAALLQTVSGGTQGNGLASGYITLMASGVNTESGIGCIGFGGQAAGAVQAVAGLLGIGGGPTLGTAICNLFRATQGFPAFLTALAYLFGVFLVVWGLIKLNEHIQEPSRTQIWDGLSKLLVAGLLFALPLIVTVAFNTVMNATIPHTNTGFNEAGVQGGGLDAMMVSLMQNVFGPLTTLINWFGILAGFVFVFIGVTRLLKSSQEGAKGPGGIGTMMTFVTGGLLLSFSPILANLTTSLIGVSMTQTQGELLYTAGMNAAEVAHANAVIAAVVRFVMLLGFISVMRGIFIMRSISEGNSQASMMAGLTHIVGGGIAVNLGPFVNMMQNTLGLSGMGVGVSFGAGGGGGIVGAIGGLLGG
jgi:hypothetical protein